LIKPTRILTKARRFLAELHARPMTLATGASTALHNHYLINSGVTRVIEKGSLRKRRRQGVRTASAIHSLVLILFYDHLLDYTAEHDPVSVLVQRPSSGPPAGRAATTAPTAVSADSAQTGDVDITLNAHSER
jgi:hypothetical protein